jgi:hypothetical protein
VPNLLLAQATRPQQVRHNPSAHPSASFLDVEDDALANRKLASAFRTIKGCVARLDVSTAQVAAM